MLRQIDEIWLIIQGRNYSELRSLVERELNASRAALHTSELYMLTSKINHDNAVDYLTNFGSLEPIFRHQLRKAASSVAVSKNGEKINKQASLYQPDVSNIH